MSLTYWNPLAINLCVLIILLTAIVGYLLVLLVRARRAQRWNRGLVLLLTIYGGGLGAVGFQFLGYVLHPDYINFALPWVSVAGAVAMGGFVRFAYEFQRPNWRIGWLGTTLNFIYICIFLNEAYVAIERVRLLQDGFVEFRDAWLDIPFTLGFLPAYLFYIERYVTAIAQHFGGSRLSTLGAAVKGLFQRSGKIGHDATATRSLIFVSMLPFVHVVLLTLRSFGWLDWAVIEPIGALLYLLMFGGFAVAYLNHAPEDSTFQVKLVGASLVAVLSIASGISWLIGPVYIDTYRSPDRLLPGTSILFTPTPDGAYSVSRTVHKFEAVQVNTTPQKPSTGSEDGSQDVKITTEDAISLPFSFPFYGQDYDRIFVRADGMMSFGGYPTWRNIQHRFGPYPAIYAITAALQPIENAGAPSGLFMRSDAEQVSFTFSRLTSPFATTGDYTFQVRLYPDGRIVMAFNNLPDRFVADMHRAHATPMITGIVPGWKDRRVDHIRFGTDLPLTGAPGSGLMEHHRLGFLAYLDQIYRPTANFLIAASLLALLLFPRFYHNNLNLPLQALLQGVRGMMRGNLRTSIPVEHRDELGYLAQSFNQMAQSQYELITTLEEKVAARTAEATALAEKNARLQERQHLSRELHDAVSQTLFTANLVAGRLPDLIEKNSVDARTELATLQSLNKDALREMRVLLQELRPEPLLNDTFGMQLRSLVDSIETMHDVTVSLSIEQDIRLPDEVQLALYRVAQEALHNAVKHAGTQQIALLFDGMADQALLSISDKGAGFDPAARKQGQFGLTTMGERLRAIGGTLDIDTHPGDGTRITAIWYNTHGT